MLKKNCLKVKYPLKHILCTTTLAVLARANAVTFIYERVCVHVLWAH